MSVICGFFSLNHDKSPLAYGNRMISVLDGAPVDKVECWHNENAYLSCHHQFITPESAHESLPYHDTEAGIVIVASAIIDNRKELFEALSIPLSEREKYTDSRLILLAYKKWGEACPEHLLGDYSYAIYEEKTNEVVCARDHAGRCTFYYTFNESYFAFSSIMKPLLSVTEDNELDEQWIADFLSIPTVIAEMDPGSTVFRAIRQLKPAHTLVLRDRQLKLSNFWDPFKAPRIRFKTDTEYDEAFREVLTESVRCKLRSGGNVGILLSGGFDSSTIGCVAAGLLQSEGKRLKSYTSVPMEGYIERFGKNAVTDESPYVEEILKMYPNIDATFCRSEGMDSYNGIERYLNVIEQPYKVVENLFWHFDIYERAGKDNCKVLLSGQYGNITISHSDYFTHFQTLLRSGRLFKLLDELQLYSRNHGIGRKRVAKEIIMGYLPLLNYFFSNKTVHDRYRRSFTLVNPLLAELHGEYARLDKARYNNKRYRSFTLKEFHKYAARYPIFSQSSGIEKKIEFHNGIITRDPTKDKRLIEFCFGLPADQFIRNGRDRVILRRSVKGIIPEKIRMNNTTKGVQAADWLQRLMPFWDEIGRQVLAFLEEPDMKRYFNTEEIHKFLINNPELKLDANAVDIRQVMIVDIFGKFLTDAKRGN